MNRTVAEEFTKEYARETGQQLSIKDCSRDFPDVVLESNGSELGIELVSIPLAFLPQEIAARREFTQAVVNRLRGSEPEIQNYAPYVPSAFQRRTLRIGKECYRKPMTCSEIVYFR